MTPSSQEFELLKQPPYHVLSRCMNGKAVLKVAAAQVFGLTWLIDMPDHNYNSLVITDYKYEKIKTKLRESGRLNCFSRVVLWVVY